jgi:hypothetical protein
MSSHHYHSRRHSLPSEADLGRDLTAILNDKDEQERLARLQAYTLEASLDPQAAMTSLAPGISRTLIPITRPKSKEKQRSITKCTFTSYPLSNSLTILIVFTPLWRRPSISPAFNPQHIHHVSYDNETGRFTGLPTEWARLLTTDDDTASNGSSSKRHGGGHWGALIQQELSTSVPMSSSMPPNQRVVSHSAPSSPTTSTYPYPLSYPHLLPEQEKSVEEDGSEHGTEKEEEGGTMFEMMTPGQPVQTQILKALSTKDKKRMTMYSVAGSSISDASRYRKPAPRPDSFTSTTPSVSQPEPSDSPMSKYDNDDEDLVDMTYKKYGSAESQDAKSKDNSAHSTTTRPTTTLIGMPIPIPARPSALKATQNQEGNEHGSGTTPRPLPPLPSPYYTPPLNQ